MTLLQIADTISTARSLASMTPIMLISVAALFGWIVAIKFHIENTKLQVAMVTKAEVVTEKVVEVTIEAKIAFEKVALLQKELLDEMRELKRNKP